ncbi:ATP synthase subunit I [Rubrivirga sp.]|uniref:ATP synthase subunit I n=1 Tax=Rubrivirga sp. TaxID=1885344 RepID=UPI003B529679
MTVSASLMLGALVGAVNAVGAAWTAHRATAGEPGRALNLVLGGMVVRMVLILGAVALVLALLPVHRGAFVGGLGLLFVGGLLAEIAIALGRAPGSSRPPADA